jgi:hypothetical protein
MDTPQPFECLAEEKQALVALQAGNTHGVPPWLTQEEAIKESEANISALVAHIAQFGNHWTKGWDD